MVKNYAVHSDKSGIVLRFLMKRNIKTQFLTYLSVLFEKKL